MYDYQVKFLRIIDGDTIECDVDLGFRITVRQKFRLKGINAPEMHTPQGPLSKARLEQITNGWKDGLSVTTEKDKQEKYGRYLATLWGRHGDALQNLNRLMVDEGFAEPYMEAQ